jgi:glyoxylate/hydroxypyruvate reductase
MALLIVDLDRYIGNAEAWRDTFRQEIPELEIRIWPDAGDPDEIDYLAFMRPNFDALPNFPRLKAMFSRSAGVETFVDHPRLPKAPLGKIEPPGGDPMMTEYVVMHVLRLHRDMPDIRQHKPGANGDAPGSCGPRSGASAFSGSD